MYVTGNPLRDDKDRKKSNPFTIHSQANTIYYIHCLKITCNWSLKRLNSIILDSPGNQDGHLCLLIGSCKEKINTSVPTGSSFAT